MTNEEIIATLGLNNADEDMQNRVVENVRTVVELRVIGALADALSEDQQQKLTELVDAGDSEAVWNFLKSDVAGTDVSEVYEAALRDYLEERQQEEFKAEQ